MSPLEGSCSRWCPGVRVAVLAGVCTCVWQDEECVAVFVVRSDLDVKYASPLLRHVPPYAACVHKNAHRSAPQRPASTPITSGDITPLEPRLGALCCPMIQCGVACIGHTKHRQVLGTATSLHSLTCPHSGALTDFCVDDCGGLTPHRHPFEGVGGGKRGMTSGVAVWSLACTCEPRPLPAQLPSCPASAGMRRLMHAAQPLHQHR
jgi:hypothetical protein